MSLKFETVLKWIIDFSNLQYYLLKQLRLTKRLGTVWQFWLLYLLQNFRNLPTCRVQRYFLFAKHHFYNFLLPYYVCSFFAFSVSRADLLMYFCCSYVLLLLEWFWRFDCVMIFIKSTRVLHRWISMILKCGQFVRNGAKAWQWALGLL